MKKSEKIEYIGFIKQIQCLGRSLSYYIFGSGSNPELKAEKVKEGIKLTHIGIPNKYVIIPTANISCIVYKTAGETDEVK